MTKQRTRYQVGGPSVEDKYVGAKAIVEHVDSLTWSVVELTGRIRTVVEFGVVEYPEVEVDDGHVTYWHDLELLRWDPNQVDKSLHMDSRIPWVDGNGTGGERP